LLLVDEEHVLRIQLCLAVDAQELEDGLLDHDPESARIPGDK